MPSTAPKSAAQSPAQQLAAFVAKYEPEVGTLFRATRAVMRRRFPTATELVYDNYQFLAVGYCASDRASSCVVSLAVSPKGVALSFYRGATLPDPRGVLRGEGKQNRFIRLDSAATLAKPDVMALLDAAEAQNPLPASGKGRTVIKSISAKQRPRRAAT